MVLNFILQNRGNLNAISGHTDAEHGSVHCRVETSLSALGAVLRVMEDNRIALTLDFRGHQPARLTFSPSRSARLPFVLSHRGFQKKSF